jgi:hypothetical protein
MHFQTPRHLARMKSQTSRLLDRSSIPLIVIGFAVVFFAGAMSRSFYDGRMAAPFTHDDVNYFIIGIQRLLLLRREGVVAMFFHFIHVPEHSPFLTYQATLAYLILGISDWAPYASNIFLLLTLFGVAALLVRDCPAIAIAACLASVIAFPISSNVAVEFSPEIVCSLFTAIGAVLLSRLPLLSAPLGARFRAGLCFGLGFFAHPVASSFTCVALLSTIGWMFVRDVLLARKFESIATGIRQSAVNLFFSLWLPILYVLPKYQVYWDYFYRTILDPATRWRWENPDASFLQTLNYYLFGPGGQYMFGRNRLWECGIIIAVGLTAAWQRKDRALLGRQAELCLLAAIFWIVPTLAPIQNGEYASCFGFTVVFLTVLGLRSIFASMNGKLGGVTLSLIAAILVITDLSLWPVPNTPGTAIEREFAFSAIDRLKAVLLGNATQPEGTKIYMTNIGAYAPNILQYYMLKANPSLDWDFESGVLVSNPQEQIDAINRMQPTFVIAGHRDNGFTYSHWAWDAEEPVLAAISRDRDYSVIDRFYGPHGRTISVFQRRVRFAGWRPISGISDPSGEPDGPRISTGGVAYLQTYAANPTTAELQLECSGMPRETISVLVNQRKVAELTLPVAGPASLRQEIDVSSGGNDILLQYNAAGEVTITSLLIIPKLPQ